MRRRTRTTRSLAAWAACLGLLLGLVQARAAAPASSVAACGCTAPVLRAAVLNTGGSDSQPDAAARMTALASELPQRAAERGLDAMCLTETRSPTLRDTVLQAFRSDTRWNVYQPPAQSKAGCKNACYTHRTYSAYNFILPDNKWLEYCTLTPVPGRGSACAQATSESEFQSCLDDFCPWVSPRWQTNATCGSCVKDPVEGESRVSRIFKCAATRTGTDAAHCWAGDSNEAGATLLSRLPFVETGYSALALPPLPSTWDGDPQVLDIPGVANWGVAYGKVQTASGPVHLFCASMATGDLGMDPALAQQMNAQHSQQVQAYVRSKAGDEPVLLMADTGSGPAVVASPTGPAAARWPENFAVLQGSLRDALLANVDAAAQPAPAAACTFGCNSSTAGAARYADHILSGGRATVLGGQRAELCHRRGSLLFTAATVATPTGPVTPSAHFGVATDLCLAQQRCDVNNDGSIDQRDLTLISRQRNQPLSSATEAYDGNGDGRINTADVQACTQRCTRAQCAAP